MKISFSNCCLSDFESSSISLELIFFFVGCIAVWSVFGQQAKSKNYGGVPGAVHEGGENPWKSSISHAYVCLVTEVCFLLSVMVFMVNCSLHCFVCT